MFTQKSVFFGKTLVYTPDNLPIIELLILMKSLTPTTCFLRIHFL